PFFKSVSPDNYMELAIKLAEGYSSGGHFDTAIRMYKHIIKENPDSHLILTYQREILENTYKIGIKSKIIEEARRLVKLLAKMRASAPQDYLKKEEARIEETVRVIATTYHKEVEITKEEATVEFIVFLYDEYLKLWPESPEAYKINLNYAIMLDQTGKHEEAARAYENLIRLNPQGEFTKEAAHAVVVSYYKKIDLSKKIVKGEDTEELEPVEIPEEEKKMISACDRYVGMSGSGDPDVPEAKFVVGKLYYEYNYFDKSVEIFKDFIERYPDHPNAVDAARLLLSSFHLKRDIKGLNHWADVISRNPKLNTGDIEALTTKIKDQAEFNKCFEFEKDGRHEQAGECFLGYVQKFPATELLDRALFNAANNFFKAKLVEKALQANEELYNKAPKSSLGPKALFNIGEIF
ncbi:MAG: tetratricopeptide repeat protein, partial [Deltaproteobacteria bacterium]|nr:tetratricopeptide repeat protein [Deltaproteobacteria bacterium]